MLCLWLSMYLPKHSLPQAIDVTPSESCCQQRSTPSVYGEESTGLPVNTNAIPPDPALELLQSEVPPVREQVAPIPKPQSGQDVFPSSLSVSEALHSSAVDSVSSLELRPPLLTLSNVAFILMDSSVATLASTAVTTDNTGGMSLHALPIPQHLRPAKSHYGNGARLMIDPVAYPQPIPSIPLGASLEMKLKDCIVQGLYVPMNVILSLEEGGNVNLHTLSMASQGGVCSCPHLHPITID